MAEQQGKERKEQRLFAGLTLIALLADLFPTPDTVRVEFGQSNAINAASVVARLNNVADQVIAQRKAEGDDTVDGLLMASKVCAGKTYSPYSRRKVGRVSSIRSQTEMATRWIQLLQEEGFLLKTAVCRESPTGIRPKNSNIICAILASKRRCALS